MFGALRDPSPDYWGHRLIERRFGTPGPNGGRTYDAIIAKCAVRAQATALRTLNALHFQGLEPAHARVVVPSPT